GRQSRISKARARRGCDLGKRGAPSARAALHAIAGDADVVGGRAPGEIDLRRARGRGGERAGGARCARVGGARRRGGGVGHGELHVELDLGGGGRGGVGGDPGRGGG